MDGSYEEFTWLRNDADDDFPFSDTTVMVESTTRTFKNDAGEDQIEVQKNIFSESFDHLGVRVIMVDHQINANWVEGSTVLR